MWEIIKEEGPLTTARITGRFHEVCAEVRMFTNKLVVSSFDLE